MKNDDFNYKFQYENWHNESDKSRTNDINDSLNFLNIHDAVHNSKEAKILEIGCGMGRFMLALKQLGYTNVKGFDIDNSQIEIAKKENLDVCLMDASEYLEKSDEIFDVIYCVDVLEHIQKEKQLEFMKLLNNHLSETGFIVMRIPNAIAPTATYYRYDDFTHNVLYTDKVISFLSKNVGLMYIANRPSHQESEEIQKLKLPWAELYRKEFGIQNPILTPNIVSIIFKNEKSYNDYINNAPIINNEYKIISKGYKKYPKWLINLLCCFVPKKKNRKSLREKYIKINNIFENVNIQDYQKDSIKLFLKNNSFKNKVVLEIGGSNHPVDFVFNKLKAKKWICIDLIMDYQIENNPEHYKNITICDITNPELEHIIKQNKYIVIKGDINIIIKQLINKIDVVYSVCSFEHISNIDVTIDNIYKYLKNNGVLFSYFGPIYSGFNGSHFTSDNRQLRFNNQPNELDFLHLLYSKSEIEKVLRDLLKNRATENELKDIIYYYINESKFVNELFYSDYDKIMHNSQFSNNYNISKVFCKDVPKETLKLLNEKYPFEQNFDASSIVIQAIKK